MASRDEVYSKFGMTAEAAQLLETALGTALLGIKGLKRGWHLSPQPDEAWRALDRIEKSTLGTLLKEIQEHVTFEGDLPAFFFAALKTRNRLMHGFYEHHNFKIQTDEGRDEMLADLETMHTELFNAWQVADQISSATVATSIEQARDETFKQDERAQLLKVIREGVVASAIRAALLAGGVNPKALKIGVAHIRKHMPLEVTKDGDSGFRVEVVGPEGRIPLKMAIATWLSTEEAKLLLSKG